MVSSMEIIQLEQKYCTMSYHLPELFPPDSLREIFATESWFTVTISKIARDLLLLFFLSVYGSVHYFLYFLCKIGKYLYLDHLKR